MSHQQDKMDQQDQQEHDLRKDNSESPVNVEQEEDNATQEEDNATQEEQLNQIDVGEDNQEEGAEGNGEDMEAMD